MKLNFVSPLITVILLVLLNPISLFSQQDSINQATEQTQTKQPQTQQTRVAAPRLLPDDLRIEELYQYMTEKSSTYQEYKVIRIAWVNKFKTQLTDSLQYLRTNIFDNQLNISRKSDQIDSLDNLLKETNSRIASVLKEKNSLKLFGILMSKEVYDAVMWIIIGVLIAVAVLLFVLFKRNLTTTQLTKKDLQETRDEYEDFRKKALKSKEDAVRMIYDELKKYKK